MDFQYEGADDLGGRILWGRVGILAVAVIFFFLMGRCSASGSDIDVAQLEAAQTEAAAAAAQVTTLTQDNQRLLQENAQLQSEIDAAGITSPIVPGGGGAGEPTDGSTPAAPTGGTTDQLYQVQPGDTLSTIAAQVYNDPSKYLAIATANGINGDDPLTVGQELVIPANPDSQG